MKRLLPLILIVCMLCAACDGSNAAQPTPTPQVSGGQPAPTLGTQNDPGATATSKLEQNPRPLELGELVLEAASVDEIIAKYGEYTSHETAFYPGNGHAYIRINYPDRIIELESVYGQSEPSFIPNNLDEGFDFGDKAIDITPQDRQLKYSVMSMSWIDPGQEGPRGTKTGDSLEAVKSKFLDKSSQYDDGRTVYTIADVDPTIKLDDTVPSGALYREWSSEGQTNALFDDAQYVLDYYANHTGELAGDYQYTRYYMIDDKVIAIEQGYSPNTP